MRTFAASLLATLLAAPSIAAPPRVVRVTPDTAELAVDPATAEIRVEFDQDMNPRSRSICGGGDSFPPTNGQARWESPRILVMPVSLKPGKQYSFSINCQSFRNFVNMAGEPCEIYPVVFRTIADPANPAGITTPDQNRAAVDKLAELIQNEYSYRDRTGVDWPARIAAHRPALENAPTAGAFARELRACLAPAQDRHLNLNVSGIFLATCPSAITPNIDERLVSKVVPAFTPVNPRLSTGTFDDGIAYILISSWNSAGASKDKSSAEMEAIQNALDAARSAPGIIIDVRANGGGNESLARAVAARFLTEKYTYSRTRLRDAKAEGGFSGPFDRSCEPAPEPKRFTGKVAVLQGPVCLSSNESFLLMMRGAPKHRSFGATSGGSSGRPLTHELGNGVDILLPSWIDLLPDGTMLEGKGVTPDEPVDYTPDATTGEDAVIAAALRWLRSPGPP